ncbi:MAG: cell division protein FtsA [bacterium]|nr:cell division protein FtsA [bacterium]
MARDKVISAIDVGSNKVTTVVASVDADGKASVIGVSTVPSAGLRKGQVVDIEAAVAAISSGVDAAERMAGLSIGSAFVSVGGAHIQSQNSKGVVAVAEPEGEITKVDIKRVTDAARAISIPSSREILHVIPRGYIVDGQEGIKDPVGMTGVRLEVETQIVTGATTTVRNLAKCISQIGIDIDGLVYSGLASSYSTLSETEKELGVILVDIGAGTTDVAIYVDGALSYSSVIPIGAKNVTNDLAIGLRVSLESAEKIKLALGTKPKFAVEKSKEDDELDVTGLGLAEELKKVSKKTLIEGIIKPRLSEVFTYVGMELQKSELTGLTPSGLVITGGGAETIGILDIARSRLVMPVRIGTPTGLTGLVDEISNPKFATAYGLILYGLENGVTQKSAGLPKLPGFASIVSKLPLKNIFGKATGFLKNFLP